jgi:TPR repeat protein
MGRMYMAGRGIRQSDVEAYQWFARAAAQGHPDAGKQMAEVAKRLTAEQIAQAKQTTRP